MRIRRRRARSSARNPRGAGPAPRQVPFAPAILRTSWRPAKTPRKGAARLRQRQQQRRSRPIQPRLPSTLFARSPLQPQAPQEGLVVRFAAEEIADELVAIDGAASFEDGAAVVEA